MKKTLRVLFSRFSVFILILTSVLGWGQTNPTAQSLPFSFTSMTSGSTILPAGMAMHRFGTSAGAIPVTRTTAIANDDLPNVTMSNSGGWMNETTKGVSLLASSSQSAGALVVAINTTGLTNIQVSWKTGTILQQASYDCSIALQYRIGTSGTWTDVGTTTTYTSQAKAAGDVSSTYLETLPIAAENNSVVQVRWIYWVSNGASGSRDRLNIDEIAISGASSGTPSLSTSSLTAFGNVCTNTTTSANSFRIIGTNLNAGNISIGALSGFSYSTSSTGTYTSTLTIPQSGGSFSQDIFVKFNPTLVQSYSGNIAVSGGGATSINVATSGNGINTPTTVDTPTVSGITSNSATLGGNISSIGCSNATVRGIEWSTTNGFANGSGTQVSSSGTFGTGTFINSVTGLPPGIVIYFKAFATNSGGTSYSAQSSFTTACNTFSYPFTETFETSSTSLNCWTQKQEIGTGNWTYATGSSGGVITAANSGTRNARFVSVSGTNTPITKLISPNIDLSSATNPILEFYYGQELWSPDQNQLKVYYSNDGGTSWNLLKTYTDNVNAWTKDEILLPSPTANYKVAFEGINNYGYANVIDDVLIKEVVPKVDFSATVASVNENSTTYTITVNSNIVGSHKVDIYVSGGTATNGSEYSFSTISADFSSSTTYTTNVTIINNNICSGGNKNIIFGLQNFTDGAVVGANNSLTLTILDDEYFSGNIKTLRFETGDDWTYTGTGGTNTTASKYNGTQSYRIGGTGNLETDNISIVGYNNVTLQVAFAATGVDSGEDLFLDISYDNGSNWSSTKLIDGFSEANINIGTTNSIDPTTVATNPWVVNIPSTESQIKVRVRTVGLEASEYYWVDDIILSGQYCISCSEPTINSVFYANSPQNITANSVTLNWTSGNGSNRIVVLKEDSAVTFVPSDNTTYQSNTNFGSGTDLGSGQFIVYNGNSNTVNITGLTPGKTYYAAIFDYGCLSGSENYLTANVSTDMFVVSPENPVAIQKVCSTNNSIELSWQAPSIGVFDGYILTVRQGAIPSNVNTIDPTTVTSANTDISSAQAYGTASYFVYKGNSNSANITGLTSGQSYTFKIYAYTDAGSIYEYSSGTQTTQSVSIPDVASPVAFHGDTTASISWSNPNTGCYDDIMAVVTTTSGITFTPSGDSYTANSVYSSPNQVVYKNTANNFTFTGLTNGVTYYVEIFVRKGMQWSTGVEIALTTSAVTGTTLQAGDFAIVAINTSAALNSSEDELTFVCFKDILPGTHIYLTDNGYERKYSQKWGNSEGIISLERTTSQLDKGTFVTIKTKNNGVKTGSDFTIYVCGTEDTNWTKDEISTNGVFDLNKDDQVWFMQGGVWTNIDTGDHDATYNGNILYGWTDIPWKTTLAWDLANGTKGSTIPSGFKCFTTDVNNPETGASRVQFNYSAYSGITTNDQLEWIALINNTANWNYYTTNANYYGSTNYSIYNSCSVVSIAYDSHTNGKWNGTKDVNWFNCSNWDTLRVPDASTNVTFNSTVANNATIDATATDSDFYGDVARVLNLTIDKSLTIEASPNNKLEIYGNLTLNAGGTLDMDDSNASTQDGQIYLYGNWANNAGDSIFLQGQSTIHFLGNATQVINNNNHSNVETFGNVVLGNNFDTAVSNDLIMDGTLTINANKTLTINTSGNFVEVVGNVTNNGNLTVENDGNFIQREGTFIGNNINVKRNAELKKFDYNYWGSPVINQNLKSFSPGTLNSRFYTYSESDDFFYTINPTTNTFQKGVGYAIRASNSAPSTLAPFYGSYNGQPHNGTFTVPVSSSSADRGHNLIANPYPSNIDLDSFFDANSGVIHKVAYFWTNVNPNPEMQGNQYPKTGSINNYAVYSGTGGLAAPYGFNGGGNNDTVGTSTNCPTCKIPNNIIKVGQGFIVKAHTPGNLLFNNSMRSKDNSGNFFNRQVNNKKDRFWLELKTPLNFVNPILIGYVKGGTNNFELDYDAPLLVEGADAFYSILKNKKLAIQGRKYPFNGNDKVALGAIFYETGKHTISLAKKEGGFANNRQPIYLHDKKEELYINLQKDSYIFSAEKGETTDRFEIVYNTSNRILETNEINKYGLLIYEADNHFVIKADEIFDQVKIYDFSGKLLKTIEAGKKQIWVEKSILNTGTNIFSIIFADEMINKKIISK